MTKKLGICAAAVSLAVAGTCLAAPAFAADRSVGSGLGGALGSVAQAAEEKAETAQPGAEEAAVTLGNHVDFAGLAFDVPQGYEGEVDEDEAAIGFTNETGSTAVMVYDLRDADLGDDIDWGEFFGELAQASVEDYEDASVEDLGADELVDGVTGYAYGLVVSDGDDTYVMVQLFVPMGQGGFSFMQIGYSVADATDDEVDELTGIIDSIELSDDDKVGIDDLEGSSCGLTFELPEGVEPYEGDDNAWIDADSNILVKAVGGVADDASKLTDADYERLFDLLEPEGETADAKVELLSSGVEAGKGVDVHYASYSVEEDGETMFCAVMVAPAADDTLSVVIAWCSEEGADEYGEAIMDMMGTFAQE